MPISKIKSSSITADAASTNLNIDANTLFLDATNNRIGIGTTTPSQKLHVNVDSGNVYEQISSGANNVYLGFESARTASVVQSNNALVFDVGSSYTERMRITAGGDVGIGASNPAYKLDVVGTGSIISATRADTNRADIIVNNTGGTVAFGINNAAGNWLSGGLGYYGYILGPSSASYGLQFGVGASNTAALTITPVGRVGIGTVSPVAQLDIENSSAQPFGTAAQLNAIFKGSVSIGQGGAIGFDYFGNHTNAPTSMGYAIESQAGSTKGSLVFGTRSVTTDTAPTERMRITSAGNVGIGTAIPNQKLTLGSSDGTQALSFVTSAYMGDNALIGNIEFSTFNADVSSGYDNLTNIKAYKTGTNTNSGDLTFWTKSNGAVGEKLRIKHNGSIGIGRDNPAYLIDAFDVTQGATTIRLLNSFGLGTSNAYGYSRFQGLAGGNGLFLSQNVNGINGAGSVLDSSSHSGFAFSMGENYSGWAFLKYAAAGGTVTPTVSMFLTTAGNLLVGTTSSTGSTSNGKKIVGGNFSSFSGEIYSALTNTFYTMFDTGSDYGCFIVSVIGIAADAANYSTTAIVNIQATTVSISYIDTGGLIFITNSGTAIRVNQNAGGTMGTIVWSALRLI